MRQMCTSRALPGNAAGSPGGGAVACHASQLENGLLIGHQRIEHLLREGPQRLRRWRRAPAHLHADLTL